MQVNATTITLTAEEIHGGDKPLLAAIASYAAQELVQANEWGYVTVHGVRFNTIREGHTSWGTSNLLGIQLKIEDATYRAAMIRRVMFKDGTLDIAKLRAAYAECETAAVLVANKDAHQRQVIAEAKARIDEDARRAAAYPALVNALIAMQKRHGCQAYLDNPSKYPPCKACDPARAALLDAGEEV